MNVRDMVVRGIVAIVLTVLGLIAFFGLCIGGGR